MRSLCIEKNKLRFAKGFVKKNCCKEKEEKNWSYVWGRQLWNLWYTRKESKNILWLSQCWKNIFNKATKYRIESNSNRLQTMNLQSFLCFSYCYRKQYRFHSLELFRFVLPSHKLALSNWTSSFYHSCRICSCHHTTHWSLRLDLTYEDLGSLKFPPCSLFINFFFREYWLNKCSMKSITQVGNIMNITDSSQTQKTKQFFELIKYTFNI